MLSFISKLFSSKPKVDYSQLIANGAVILDVRTPSEYRAGHVKGSVNIPLQGLRGQISKLKKNKPIITCCASGSRSASARLLLQSYGFEEVYNGGPWHTLRKFVQ
ncbi:MAG: rhodanese-like domain-containing protein [Chitinophagales bacterium]|nr:rhodanese-like domain-containing protein [Chitinophagales bacterium]